MSDLPIDDVPPLATVSTEESSDAAADLEAKTALWKANVIRQKTQVIFEETGRSMTSAFLKLKQKGPPAMKLKQLYDRLVIYFNLGKSYK